MKKNCIVDTFDSELLGQTVAKVWLEKEESRNIFLELDAFFIEEQIGLVFCFAPFDASLAFFLKDYGYYPVSSQASYRLLKKESFFYPMTENYQMKNYEYSEQDQFLAEIVKELALISHYGKDPLIDQNKAVALYKKWIKNTFDGYAHKIFTAVDGQENCIGLLSLRLVDEELCIDLLGVHSQWRKNGIAAQLVQQAISYAYEQKKSLIVKTQGENIPANRFYQKYNFVLEKLDLVYHKKM